MLKLDKAKKKSHDWRPFIKLTGEQKGPHSVNVYSLALIAKQDFKNGKGPQGAILYGENGNDLKIGFLKSEFENLEQGLKEYANYVAR